MAEPKDIIVNYYTSIILLIICLIAVLANLLVIYLSFIRQKDEGIDIRLVRLITLADLFYALWGVLHTTIRFSTGRIMLEDRGWCATSLFINSSSISLSIGLVTILAAIRYRRIVQKKNINLKFWYTLIALCILYSFGITIIAMFYTDYIPEKSYTWCQPFDLKELFDFSYLTISTILYGLQIVLMTYFYLSITIAHTRRLDDFTRDMNNGFKPNSPNKLALGYFNQRTKIIIKMSVLILFYHLSITPYVLVTLIELIIGESRKAIPDAFLALTINCVNIVNPLFLILLHDPTRRDLNDVLDIIKCRFFGNPNIQLSLLN